MCREGWGLLLLWLVLDRFKAPSLTNFSSARRPYQKEINLTSFFLFEATRIIPQNSISLLVFANGFRADFLLPKHLALLRGAHKKDC